MSKRANPTVIGGFLVGAVALAVAGVLMFSSGKFLKTQVAWVMYFPGSVKGLRVGAPVSFRGVKIGEVTDVRVTLSTKDLTVLTPVTVEIEADRFEIIGPLPPGLRDPQAERTGAKELIKRGLRAQLQLESLVTGQLFVHLDLHPDTPIRLSGVESEVPEFPTIPSTIEELSKTLADLPVTELADAALHLLQDIDRLVSSPEIRATIRSADETMREIQKLVRNIDGRVAPLATSIEGTSEQARATLAQAQEALSIAGEGSPVRYQLSNMLAELAAAARSIRVMADYLARHPEALVRGKGGPGGDRR